MAETDRLKRAPRSDQAENRQRKCRRPGKEGEYLDDDIDSIVPDEDSRDDGRAPGHGDCSGQIDILTSHRAQPKVDQFRNYKYGEDIVTYMYLTTFESHYRGYNISENEWMLKLQPLLPEQQLDIVYSMKA